MKRWLLLALLMAGCRVASDCAVMCGLYVPQVVGRPMNAQTCRCVFEENGQRAEALVFCHPDCATTARKQR